jgi:hypothetical protein
MKIAYPSGDDQLASAQRHMGAKSGTRKNEVFGFVGRIEKSSCMATAVYASHWRGTTTIEIHECERLLYDWNRSGACIFIDVTLIDQFIRLLTQAGEQAKALAREKAKPARKRKPKADA